MRYVKFQQDDLIQLGGLETGEDKFWKLLM